MITQAMNDKLNAQITHEFYSSYLYRQMAAVFHQFGLMVLEQRFLKQADEEHMHALKLIDYLQKIGGMVRLGAMAAPPSDYASALQILETVLEHERGVTRKIHELAAQADEDKDYSTRSFLKWYIDEQVEEEASASELTQAARLAGSDLLALEDRVEKIMARQAAAAKSGAATEAPA